MEAFVALLSEGVFLLKLHANIFDLALIRVVVSFQRTI